MSAKLYDSIFLVTSSDSDNKQFGTAFILFRDKQAAYLLTCMHVVKNVGGSSQVRVGHYPAELIVSGSEDSLDDMAVLRVVDLFDAPVLGVSTTGEPGRPFLTAGFQSFAHGYAIRSIQGKLGERIGLQLRGQQVRTQAIDLILEGTYDIQQGYSGSPVIDQRSMGVMAVASHSLGGRKGVAISIETLERIGSEI